MHTAVIIVSGRYRSGARRPQNKKADQKVGFQAAFKWILKRL
jgi:hypothetical protein